MLHRLQFRTLLSDRGYAFSLLLLCVLALGLLVVSAWYIRPTEISVPTRYSRFDLQEFHRDRWYALFRYVGFVIVVTGLHTLISAKLYQVKGRQFALAAVYSGIAVLAVTAVFLLAIFRVTSIL